MPEIEVVAVESGATVDPKIQSWQDFQKRVRPAEEKPKSEVKQEKPVKEAESGTADTPKEEKPESAAEPGAAETQEKPKKDKLNHDERIAQLARENKELKERIRERESVTKPAVESKPETKPEPPKRPNPFKWEGTPEEYETALDKWEAHIQEQAVTRAEQARQQAQAVQQFTTKVEDTQKRYPEFAKVADETAAALLQTPPEIQTWIQQSPLAFDLIYTIGEKPEALQDFLETAKKNPSAAIRKLAFLEIEIGKELNKPKEAEAAEADKEDTPAPQKPRTPKPPIEAGGRDTAPDDVALSAVQARDFRRASAEWTRRRLAQKG